MNYDPFSININREVQQNDNILYKEGEIVGKGKQPLFAIRQHCRNCDTVLALELTDKLGFRSQSEYWYINPVLNMWVKERWYGNHVKCPNCGLEGSLPIDKPLSAETIESATADRDRAARMRATIDAKREKANRRSNHA